MWIRGGTFFTLALASILACSGGGYGGPTSPGAGGGGGGPAGAVTIGAGIQFTSQHNGTMNPAVDTITAGASVTWTWTGNLPHGVQSIGTPSFQSSGTRTGSGTYSVTFDTPGTYLYDCSTHGREMTGKIVVLGSSNDVQSVTDPQGDTFGTSGTQWDLTGLTVQRDGAGVTATLEFAQDVISPLSGEPSATTAFLDLDLDQNPATGGPAIADEFRHDGESTGLGVDARVALIAEHGDGSVAVLDGSGQEIGRVVPTFDGRRITVRIPKALLGNDDGFLDAAAITGTVGVPTDIVPQTGHLTLARGG